MAPERQPSDIKLTGIYIDLTNKVIRLDSANGRSAKLTFGDPKPVVADAPEKQPQLPVEADTSDELTAEPEEEAWEEPGAAADPSSATERREKQQTVVLSGRLRTKPKEGRPDSQGRPIAWSRLAVHEEGSDRARLYSATFHRHTAAIALGLDRGAQVTVEGYPHPGDPAQKRLDTLSVIAVHQYPGKPEGQRRRAVRRG